MTSGPWWVRGPTISAPVPTPSTCSTWCWNAACAGGSRPSSTPWGLTVLAGRPYVALAARHGVACHAVIFPTPAALCRARNKTRSRPVPPKVLTAQLGALEPARASVSVEGFDGIHEPGPVLLVPPSLVGAPERAERQKEEPMPLHFGLQIPSFTWGGGPGEIAGRLASVATAAEQAGFTSLWVMDHFLQIPQVGPEWQDMLDSYTALGFLAGRTSTVRLGALVTGVTYRNLAHLAKIVATLDTLSGGRAVCGLGAAWFEREHKMYGWEFPPAKVRYDLLADALELLPLMWGPGTPKFVGRTTTVPEAICYPRPVQSKIPLLVGGSGEKKTLRLVARHANACNLFGDPATVRRKLDVLDGHCFEEGRTRSEIKVTHLSTVLVGRGRADVDGAIERLRPDPFPRRPLPPGSRRGPSRTRSGASVTTRRRGSTPPSSTCPTSTPPRWSASPKSSPPFPATPPPGSSSGMSGKGVGTCGTSRFLWDLMLYSDHKAHRNT